MTKLGDVNNYHDLAGLQQLKAKAKMDPANKEALNKAAEHFESIFIGMMLKSMRSANAVFEEGNPMHSNTTKFFRDMYDQQLSTDMASQGSMGLADIIVQQLSNDADSYKSASLIRNDADMQRHVFGVNDANKAASPKTMPESPLDLALGFAPSLGGQSQDASEKPAQPLGLLAQLQQGIRAPLEQIGFATVEEAPSAMTAKSDQAKKDTVDFESPEDFIQRMWQFAKKAATEIGLNPSVMIAQSALETGWGKHIIKDKNGDSSFNLFNVKAHRDWNGAKAAQSTLEFEDGVAVRRVEPFRVYQDFTESFSDFVNFLRSNRRYEDALNKTKDEEQFLQELQSAGYATDPNYASKILTILNSETFKDSIGKVDAMADSE